MKSQPAFEAAHTWKALRVPTRSEQPQPVVVRVQTIGPRHYFPAHSHPWNQLIYAISGVLTVALDDRCLVIPTEHAVWVPPGVLHQVGSLHGAAFRSLYVVDRPDLGISSLCDAYRVSPLLRALIVEAAEVGNTPNKVYTSRILDLIVDQLPRLPRANLALAWPRSPRLKQFCESLYANPADDKSLDEWSALLHVSPRTLTRHFSEELGMPLRLWRQQLRLLRAIELLQNGSSVTSAALEVGYASPSAFTFMFRQATGFSPTEYLSGPRQSNKR
jgi:AraC-like DNA-binding protein/quercetin dioxygenase-like cupin family protein